MAEDKWEYTWIPSLELASPIQNQFCLWLQQQGRLCAGSWWSLLWITAGAWEKTLLTAASRMCVVFPTPTVLLPVMHPYSTFTDTSVFSTAVRKLCNRDVACQEPYKCQPPFSHSWEGPGQTGRSPGWKNKAAKHQKVEKYVLGYFPYAEWFESMSQNPQSELSLNFFNLICPALLGRHIKNLVGKEQKNDAT